MPDQTVSLGSSSGSPEAPLYEDERIKGLQRAVSEKETALKESQRQAAAFQAQLEEYRLAQLSETERSSVLNQREQSRLREIELENERLKLALKYPDEAQHYEALLRASSAEEQVLYLKRLRNPQSGSPELETSDVDLNNPMRSFNDAIGSAPNSVMDEATADRIFAAWGDRPAAG